jgi:hypothetical protein
MEYQTFSHFGLSSVIRKSDFLNTSEKEQEFHRENLLSGAVDSAKHHFMVNGNPLISFTLKGKTVFRLSDHPSKIVERKLRTNLVKIYKPAPIDRLKSIENLKTLLSEGVSYRFYRLDISNFYESFSKDLILDEIKNNNLLSPHSKSLIESLLKAHKEINGEGVPRGLSISSTLSEIMMMNFDKKIKNLSHVFYYSRYVDDIIIITSGNECSNLFTKLVKRSLPTGLFLNRKKSKISKKIDKLDRLEATEIFVDKFDYLGYNFSIVNPAKKNSKEIKRHIKVDIAPIKIKKYKTRIARSFFDFFKTKDFGLLRDRIKYLACNFKLFNPHTHESKIVGIYYNYPSVQDCLDGLVELDNYLRMKILKGYGRSGKVASPLLSPRMKRELLSYSFVKGHKERSFSKFSSHRIHEINKCWQH